MNCAELHLNPNNIDNYEGESLYMAPSWIHFAHLEPRFDAFADGNR